MSKNEVKIDSSNLLIHLILASASLRTQNLDSRKSKEISLEKLRNTAKTEEKTQSLRLRDQLKEGL
jgi:hypothetical protein